MCCCPTETARRCIDTNISMPTKFPFCTKSTSKNKSRQGKCNSRGKVLYLAAAMSLSMACPTSPMRMVGASKDISMELSDGQIKEPCGLSFEQLSGLPDPDLLAHLRSGHSDALAVLFGRYHRLILSVAFKILRDPAEAEDVMQSVFLEIYRVAGQFDAARGTVKVWLLQYAYHRSLNRREYLKVRGFYERSRTRTPSSNSKEMLRRGRRAGLADSSRSPLPGAGGVGEPESFPADRAAHGVFRGHAAQRHRREDRRFPGKRAASLLSRASPSAVVVAAQQWEREQQADQEGGI